MPKNPTTPPKATRKSQRGRDNTNLFWAPKRKRDSSPKTQRKLRISEIIGAENQVEQIKFFHGATQQGKVRYKLLSEVLEDRRKELNEMENSEIHWTINM